MRERLGFRYVWGWERRMRDCNFAWRRRRKSGRSRVSFKWRSRFRISRLGVRFFYLVRIFWIKKRFLWFGAFWVRFFRQMLADS